MSATCTASCKNPTKESRHRHQRHSHQCYPMPSQIGTFQITGVIKHDPAQGVFSAIDACMTSLTFCKRFVIKRIKRRRPLDSERRVSQVPVQYDLASFTDAQTEIALQKRVQDHPYILPIQQVWGDNQFFYVVVEMCNRGDLFTAITERRQYVGDDRQARTAFLQILDAVIYCHERGVYHCDLKPENILVSDDGSCIKLADFGLATVNAMSSDHGCGSSFYMAPERLTPNRRLSCRAVYPTSCSDVWALGVILLNLVCGRNPWHQAILSNDISTYLASPPSDTSCGQPASHAPSSFGQFLKDPTFLEKILPVSSQLNGILRQVFCTNPFERISIYQLRTMVQSCPRLSRIVNVTPPRLVLFPHCFDADESCTPYDANDGPMEDGLLPPLEISPSKLKANRIQFQKRSQSPSASRSCSISSFSTNFSSSSSSSSMDGTGNRKRSVDESCEPSKRHKKLDPVLLTPTSP